MPWASSGGPGAGKASWERRAGRTPGEQKPERSVRTGKGGEGRGGGEGEWRGGLRATWSFKALGLEACGGPPRLFAALVEGPLCNHVSLFTSLCSWGRWCETGDA